MQVGPKQLLTCVNACYSRLYFAKVERMYYFPETQYLPFSLKAGIAVKSCSYSKQVESMGNEEKESHGFAVLEMET